MIGTLRATGRRETHVAVARPLTSAADFRFEVVPAVILGLLSLLSILLIL